MRRRFVHPLTLIAGACAATLLIWLNCNFRVRPLIERTTFSNPQDHIAFQFKELQYDLYKDKVFGWPKDAYNTTLDRIKDPANPSAHMVPQLKVIGFWDKTGLAIDVAIGALIIVVCGVVSELIMRRIGRRKESLPEKAN